MLSTWVLVATPSDVNLRHALCQAATVMMYRGRATWLRTWGAKLARRRGAKRAMVALARRIAVILHRMWVNRNRPIVTALAGSTDIWGA